jgi:hypothetical protein
MGGMQAAACYRRAVPVFKHPNIQNFKHVWFSTKVRKIKN